MTFTRKELASILKLAKMVALADANVDEVERMMIFKELIRFGVNTKDAQSLENEANRYEPAEAIATVAGLTPYEKRYVCAYLGTIIAADGEIKDVEMSLWSLISTLCGFPQMSIQEAIIINLSED